MKHILLFMTLSGIVLAGNAHEKEDRASYKVTQLPAQHGNYTVSPALPADGMVAAGTTITLKAVPAANYSLDATFCTFRGGMWGTTSIENFTPEMTIVVDKEMSVGATFIPKTLVENLQVIQDVQYAKPGKKPLKYDVFKPVKAKKLPCIVIVHGGGWSSNNEDVMRGLARELAKDGKYVVVSIDYRWVNQLDGDATPNSMHQLIEDVFGAIAHVREHAAEYGIDANNIAVTGDSAGGHLSASAALLSPLIGAGGFGTTAGVYEFLPSYMPANKSAAQLKAELVASIKAAAPSYGPVDAADFRMFIKQQDPGYLQAVSPSAYVPNVKQRKMPHFIVRGTADQLIKKPVVQKYADSLRAAGQVVEQYEVEGAGHAFFDWKPDAITIATFEKYGVPYAEKMRKFFDTVFYSK